MAEISKEEQAWNLLCARLGRDPKTSEESDTCTLRAAWKAMMAFSDQEAASPTLLEALEGLLADLGPEGYVLPAGALATVKARAAITLATGKDA